MALCVSVLITAKHKLSSAEAKAYAQRQRDKLNDWANKNYFVPIAPLMLKFHQLSTPFDQEQVANIMRDYGHVVTGVSIT